MTTNNVYVSREDFESAKNYLIQFLRDSGFEGSLEDGTALHDVVIKAFALLYTLYKNEVKKVEAYLSLDSANRMKAVLGNEYDNAVDAILSNWFVQRKEGTKTSGRIKMWFAKPLDFYSVSPGNRIAFIDNINYEPSHVQVFTENNFTGVVNPVNNVTEYYIYVDVVSMVNTSSKPTYTSKVAAFANNIFYLRAEIDTDFTPGIDKESTEDFIRRTQKAITTRELVTDRAISTVLTDKFPEVYNTYTAGFGAPEQYRDVVVFDNTSVHVGNKADIYLTTEFAYAKQEFVVPFDRKITISGAVLHIIRVYRIVDNTKINVVFSIDSCNELLQGSLRGSQVLLLNEATPGHTVFVEYLTAPVLHSVEDFVLDKENRVVCYDPLVKSKFPLILSFNLNIKLDNISYGDKLREQIVDTVINYIKTINKYVIPYVQSELISEIHAVSEHILSVNVPIEVYYNIFDPKAKTYRSGTVGSLFTAGNITTSSNLITQNTTQFYTDSNFITVTFY